MIASQHSIKLLLVLLVSALLPWSPALQRSTALAAGRAAPMAQALTEPELVANGVSTYTMANSAIFYLDRCATSGGPLSLNRIYAGGGSIRRLYERAGCPQGDMSSNPVADSTSVYWLSVNGLLRLSRNANVGEPPEVLSAAVRGPTNDVPFQLLRIAVVQTHDYLLVLTFEGNDQVIYRVAKADGATIELLRSTLLIFDLAADEDGLFYYRWSGTNGPQTPLLESSLYQGSYLDPQTPLVLIADGVTAYHVSPAYIDPNGCPAGSTCHPKEIYYGQGRRVVRFTPSTGKRENIYSSQAANGIVFAIAGNVRLGLGEKLYFFERRITVIDPQQERHEFLLMEHFPLSFPPGPTILHRITAVPAFPFYWPHNLLLKGEFLFWQTYEGRLLRLPRNAPGLPQQNLRITDVEVTQGVQYPDNRVPLIANRRTFVRVHVQADTSDVPDIIAELYRAGDSQPLLPVNRDPSGNPLTSLTVPHDPRRDDLNNSFLFELPADWLSGSFKLTARLNLTTPSRLPVEPNYDDNIRNVDVQFKPAPYLPIAIIPFMYTLGSGTHTPQPNDLPQIISLMNRLYPVANTVNPQQTHQGLHVGMTGPMDLPGLSERVARSHSDCEDMDEGDRNLCATKFIQAWLREQEENSGFGFWYGAPASNPFPQFSIRGQAKRKWDVAVGPSGEAGTATHEIGHLLERSHPARCGATKDDGKLDTAYPYGANAEIGPNPATMQPAEDPVNGGLMGLDIGDPALGLPMATFRWDSASDFMSYCGLAKWTSDYTYNALYNEMHNVFRTGSSQLATAPSDVLSIYGTILDSKPSAIIQRISRSLRTTPIPPRIPGPYSIQLLDAQAQVLADYPFTPEENDHAHGRAAAALELQPMPDFGVVVPFVAGTSQIRIVRIADQAVLKNISVSAKPPTIGSVALQNPSSPLTGTVTLKWVASDADGNPLTFDVFYSRDGGQRFEPLKVGVGGSSTPINTNLLSGKQVVFRVVASDGVQTAKADSPAYTLAASLPQPRILRASGRVKLLYGQNINLIGQAQDRQDGYVTDSGLRWTNQKGQLLGRGTALSLRQLPAGTTRITLTATNSAGLSASTFVELAVDDQLDPPGPTLSVGPGSVSWAVDPGTAPKQATLTIRNIGTGSLQWAASETADWLTLSSEPNNQGTAPATLVLTANVAGVPAGTTLRTTLYIYTLDSTQSTAIPITLHVNGPVQHPGGGGSLDQNTMVVGDGTAASCTAGALRSAVDALQKSGGGRVQFACGDAPHTIVLNSTLLIRANTIVDGANRITLSGDDNVRHFEVCLPNNGGEADAGLELAGLTLINGKSEPNRAGGSITNYGCRVIVSHSRFIGNRAATLGGALVSQGGRISVRNTLFQANQAQLGSGGAIFAYGAAPVDIKGSSFVANRASEHGGALSIGGLATIGNSTFAKNEAGKGGAAIRHHANDGVMTLTNVTVTGEQGKVLSGGMTLRNSIVSNTGGAANCEGPITTQGSNLEFPGTSCGASIQGQDPLLRAVSQNGGPTLTVAFDPTSPARDVGDNAICASAPIQNVDQRGVVRPLPVGGH
jgi:hypothetical protein